MWSKHRKIFRHPAFFLCLGLIPLAALMYWGSTQKSSWAQIGYETGQVEHFKYGAARSPRSKLGAVIILDDGEKITVDASNKIDIFIGDKVRVAVFKKKGSDQYRYRLVQ